ncbi:hypothetical protein Pcinc_008033 [Petrolisthes cinctipes]|uniref:Uncharacterized protein n=1 Tax=Petrolisthes cinctipes TaxID=88211 RepID=A0AAE1GE53_PETCI|nr:hypothetical protein Pcinc_008033 [Petrolisthes cinctipes]
MAKTHSRFNSKRLRSVGERKLFREVLICHHGVKHKGVKKTYTGCQVHMDVTIRTGSKNSLYSDKLMKEYPCFIIIKGNHNHPTASAEALNQLPVSPTTRMMFEKYFEQGLTTAQASRHHIWKMDLWSHTDGEVGTEVTQKWEFYAACLELGAGRQVGRSSDRNSCVKSVVCPAAKSSEVT